eukprot:m.134973 g.134973  ORF g.134973 m.134973 type:complete len:140 (+) comp23889_c0_seq4:186-605(+)
MKMSEGAIDEDLGVFGLFDNVENSTSEPKENSSPATELADDQSTASDSDLYEETDDEETKERHRIENSLNHCSLPVVCSKGTKGTSFFSACGLFLCFLTSTSLPFHCMRLSLYCDGFSSTSLRKHPTVEAIRTFNRRTS